MNHKVSLSITLALMLLLTACGPGTVSAANLPANKTPQSAAATPASSAGPTVKIDQKADLGSFLVDSKGMTLYLFTKDTPNTSACYDACAKAWPPLLATGGAPVADQGVNASLLGTTKRTDGTLQVTYNGWPLYYFAKDKQPGDVTGQDVQGVWYVISPAGDKVEAESSASSDGASISIASFKFAPQTLTVKVGTTVTWTNNDSTPHNVIADNGEFSSNTLQQNDTFSFTFTKAGTYAYYCSFHGGSGGNGMAGVVVVEP